MVESPPGQVLSPSRLRALKLAVLSRGLLDQPYCVVTWQL